MTWHASLGAILHHRSVRSKTEITDDFILTRPFKCSDPICGGESAVVVIGELAIRDRTKTASILLEFWLYLQGFRRADSLFRNTLSSVAGQRARSRCPGDLRDSPGPAVPTALGP